MTDEVREVGSGVLKARDEFNANNGVPMIRNVFASLAHESSDRVIDLIRSH